MGGVVSGLFGGGQVAQVAAAVAPPPPPVAPPAYTQPQGPGNNAGNVSDGAKAMGAFGNTIITGPEGLKAPEKTSSPSLKSQLGN